MIKKKFILATFFSVMLENIVAMDANNEQSQTQRSQKNKLIMLEQNQQTIVAQQNHVSESGKMPYNVGMQALESAFNQNTILDSRVRINEKASPFERVMGDFFPDAKRDRDLRANVSEEVIDFTQEPEQKSLMQKLFIAGRRNLPNQTFESVMGDFFPDAKRDRDLRANVSEEVIDLTQEPEQKQPVVSEQNQYIASERNQVTASTQLICDANVHMFQSNQNDGLALVNEEDVALIEETRQNSHVFITEKLSEVGNYCNYLSNDKIERLLDARYIDPNKSKEYKSPFYLEELEKIKFMAINDRNHQDGAVYSFDYNQCSILIDGEKQILGSSVQNMRHMRHMRYMEVSIMDYFCICQIEKERLSNNWVSIGVSPRDFLRIYEPEEALRLGLYTHEYLNCKFDVRFCTRESWESTWREFWGRIFISKKISYNLMLQIYGAMLNQKLSERNICEMNCLYVYKNKYKYNYNSNYITWREYLCYKFQDKASKLKLYTNEFLNQKIPNFLAEVEESISAHFSWMEFFCFNNMLEIDSGIIDIPEEFLSRFLDQVLPSRLLNKMTRQSSNKYKGITWKEYIAIECAWQGEFRNQRVDLIKIGTLANRIFTENFLNTLISPAAAAKFPKYASCTWREFFCVEKFDSANKLRLYNDAFFYKNIPEDFCKEEMLPNGLSWGELFVYRGYCCSFSSPFPRKFLDENVPKSLVDNPYCYWNGSESVYSNHGLYSNRGYTDVTYEARFDIRCFELIWGDFLCLYRRDYASKLGLYTQSLLDSWMPVGKMSYCHKIPLYRRIKWKDYLLCHAGVEIALHLKFLPENFIRDYLPKEGDVIFLGNKFDDLLKNYLRFYEEDIAERCGLYMDYILYEKIPDVITDRNPIYRGRTWYQYIYRVRDIEDNF